MRVFAVAQVSSVESNGERKQESGEPHGKSMAETL